ncbi:MAG: hypothetical protein U1E89_03925 [Burkholderiaceae bacterium]
MQIKDLDKSHELAREEQAEVHGGTGASNNVLALMVGSALVNGGSGVSIGSPVVQANPQSQTITPTATNVSLDNNVANVVGSAGTFLFQG